MPVLRNLVFLGGLAHHKGKTLCVQLFAEVAVIGGFCACLNGNAVAHLCVLSYGVYSDKTYAVFNALGLEVRLIEPSGGIIAAAGFGASELRGNSGEHDLISVVELIAADIFGAHAAKVAACHINAVDKQGVKRFAAHAVVIFAHTLFYLCSGACKGIKGSAGKVRRVHNGGFSGFKGHFRVIIAVGACGCLFVAEVHIFYVLEAYGDIHRTYKRIEFFRKSLHVRFKVLEHFIFANRAVYLVELKVNIRFKVVPCGNKCMPGFCGIVAFGVFCGVIYLKELFRIASVLLIELKSLFVSAFLNEVFPCLAACGGNSFDFRLFFLGIGFVCDCAVIVKRLCCLQRLFVGRNAFFRIF